MSRCAPFPSYLTSVQDRLNPAINPPIEKAPTPPLPRKTPAKTRRYGLDCRRRRARKTQPLSTPCYASGGRRSGSSPVAPTIQNGSPRDDTQLACWACFGAFSGHPEWNSGECEGFNGLALRLHPAVRHATAGLAIARGARLPRLYRIVSSTGEPVAQPRISAADARLATISR
jgi:hypothetical protein